MPPLQTGPAASSTRSSRPRDAASLILVRGRGASLEVLLGRREPRSSFMPSVWVFPGGRLDPADWRRPVASELDAESRRALSHHTTLDRARALGVAALRETCEETGLALGHGDADDLVADLAALTYVGRAITPTTSPTRFHARFFSARVTRARGTLRSNGELLGLRWFRIGEAQSLPIIDVTHAMLEEVARRESARRAADSGGLFIHYRNERPVIRRDR